MNEKRSLGQYFTTYNPFQNDGFKKWSLDCGLKSNIILEPFAGSNNLIHMLQEMDLCKKFVSYDIEPQNNIVQARNTLIDFPKNFDICITNPPYLARNSATQRGLHFPNTEYDDLYKHAIDKCLQHCKYVGAIIPASFLNAKLFRDRLTHYILLNTTMFNDTEHPVCLALFCNTSDDVKIYHDNQYLGYLSELEKSLPTSKQKIEMRFNDKNGSLGLIAIDNTVEPSIRFCCGKEIDSNKISTSSRSITRIAVGGNVGGNVGGLINDLNAKLTSLRQSTYDIFLTPFKGLRKDGKYRRRLDFQLARQLINDCVA